MLDELAFLINGYDGIANRRSKFKWLCYMLEVCRKRPVRFDGEKANAEFLHAHLLIRLSNLHLDDFKEEVNEVLDYLHEYDEELYYFILVATYRLSDDDLNRSLQESSLKKWQYSLDFPGRSSSFEVFSVPQLPWDISPALNADIAVPDVIKEDPIEPHDICPLDSKGVLTEQYSLLLSNDVLRIAECEAGPGPSCRILCFDEEAATTALVDMFDGISSDVFQEQDDVFSLTKNCKLGRWSIARTQAVLDVEVAAANRIHDLYRSILRNCQDHRSRKFCDLILAVMEDLKKLFQNHLSRCLNRDCSNYYCLHNFDCVVEDQTELLTICQEILSSDHIEVTKLVFTLRCLRDSTSTIRTYARDAYIVLLQRLISLVAVSVCTFASTGRCDFADQVFVEAISTKGSPDRTGYGEIWESNFSVDLPPSPDLSQRLCRMVVKQGVLVRLLNTDVASASGAPADLLKLYNIPDSDVEVCLNTELTKVLEEVEKRILEEGILVSTLEDIVEWVIR
ncbi:hypothetical protein Aduo_012215 [Ancylostoma duodenale]